MPFSQKVEHVHVRRGIGTTTKRGISGDRLLEVCSALSKQSLVWCDVRNGLVVEGGVVLQAGGADMKTQSE